MFKNGNFAAQERIIPEDTPKGIYSVHLKKYEFASGYCRTKFVLDAACGVGYGSYYLSKVAKSVTGIDNSLDAINYAKGKYQADNTIYKRADLLKQLDFDNETFDVICSFETIEHLSDINIYLQEVARVLKSDGMFFLSTPYVKKIKFRANSIYHYTEYTVNELEKILKSYFSKIEFYGQRRKSNTVHRFLRRLDVFNIRRFNLSIFKKLSRLTGNVPFGELSLDDFEIAKDDLSYADEVIAVCRKS